MAEQPASPYPYSRSHRSRLHEVDLLRFVAALMVVLLHYSYSYSKGQSEVSFAHTLGPVTKYGYLGVNLFFMISGMVVFMTLWGRTASQFLISRISRLYPAYWVAVTLTAFTVVVVGVPGRDSVSLPHYLVNMTMFAAPVDVPYVEAVYWTLWSEWRFYALLFIFSLVGLTLKRTHVFMWGWLTVSVLLGALPLPGRVEHVLALVVQPIYSHYFIAGMALYLVYRFGWTRNLSLLLLCSYANAVYQGVEYAKHNATDVFQFNEVTIVALTTAMFLTMTLAATGALTRWSSPYFARLGELTYPLYLIHGTIGNALFNWLFPAVNPGILLVCITTSMCVLSWVISRQVEARLQPIMRVYLTESWKSARAQMFALHASLNGRVSRRRPEWQNHSPADAPSHSIRGPQREVMVSIPF
jgi:peptidoglycan/LPS O-acetylase OafA/YrhL